MNIRDSIKTTAGKAVILELLDMAGIYDTTFTGNSKTYFLEGRRSMGLDLISLLDEADPTAYPTLLLNNIKEESNE